MDALTGRTVAHVSDTLAGCRWEDWFVEGAAQLHGRNEVALELEARIARARNDHVPLARRQGHTVWRRRREDRVLEPAAAVAPVEPTGEPLGLLIEAFPEAS